MSDDGYRSLAAAVLVRAIKDANERGPGDIRRCARDFLCPDDEMFNVYCGLLNYDPVAVAEGAKQRGRIVAQHGRRVRDSGATL